MEERAKREGKDDRSFFQKYVGSQNLSHLVFFNLPLHTHTQWMYILIGAFLLITLNAGQAAAGGGGGG